MTNSTSNNPYNNLICIKHIDEKHIESYIRKNYKDGICHYCNQKRKVVKLGRITDYMQLGIDNFYDDAANWMSYNSQEGGYQGTTYSNYDIITELIETDTWNITTDIISLIEDKAWADRYEGIGDPADNSVYDWEYFKEIILHKSRFLFFNDYVSNEYYFQRNASDILKEIGRYLTELGLVELLPKRIKIFRSRQHGEKDNITELCKIVSPPIKNAIFPNRFSPAGISMMYSGFSKETAIAETLNLSDRERNFITTAEFETVRYIYVINFNRLPSLPSIFDTTKIDKYFIIAFIKRLVRDFTKGISKDGMEHIEYIPTQVVTEYIRYKFNSRRKNKIEGLIYSSSKNSEGNAMVNFWDNEESQKNLKLVNIERERIDIYA